MKTLLKKVTIKNFVISAIVFLIYFKIFFLLTNYQQFLEIYKYSNSFVEFYFNSWSYFLTFWSSLDFLTFVLSILFFFLIFIFILSFVIARSGIKKQVRINILPHIISFFGFGCVACGQTLIYPILLFMFTNVSGGLVEYLGNLAMFLGIIFILFGIRTNLKLIKNMKICKV